MSKNEHKEEANNKNKIIDKIDFDNGNFPYAKDIGRTLSKTTLTGSHRAIIDVILDKTYGWYDPQSDKIQKLKKRKTKELITYRNFEDFTGIKNKHLSKYILELVNWKVINRWGKGQKYLYSFNVNVNQWDKGIFREAYQLATTRVGGSLNYHKDRGKATTRVGGSLPQGLGVVIDPKANNDKTFPDPKETIKETIYKEREKNDIYIVQNLEEEREEKEIFSYWNSLNITEHKTINFFINDIKEALKNYSLNEIKDTIGNYSLILKDEKYYYSHEHTLSGFLKPQNFEKFKDLEKAKKNFLTKKINGNNDNEEIGIPERYKSDPIKKETKEERKARYKRSENKIKELKEGLNK